MIPPTRRPRPRWDDESDGLGVLVPGLFGVGFLISLFVLAFDAIAQLLPASGRRRQALLVRDAHGRSNDLAAVRTGRAPAPGAIPCELRTRRMSALLGALGAAASLTAVLVGFAVADHVGVDRQAWAITVGLVAAVPIALVSAMWLAAAAFGDRSPAWLRALHSIWPLGTYPKFDFDSPEAVT